MYVPLSSARYCLLPLTILISGLGSVVGDEYFIIGKVLCIVVVITAERWQVMPRCQSTTPSVGCITSLTNTLTLVRKLYLT